MNVLSKRMNMKRILVYGMTNNRGGIESYLMNYFRGLRKNNIVFDFVTEYDTVAYNDEVEQLGGKIYHIPSRRESIIRHMNAIRDILKINKEYHTFYCNILSASEVFTVLSAVGMKQVEIIVHSHNDSVKTIRRHKILRPLLNQITDKKLACSERAALFMFGEKSVAKNEVKIINNAIDMEKYRYQPEVRKQMRELYDISDDIFVVGHVGRMCYQKNTLFLIDLFNEIYKKDKRTKLLLVGEGEDREKVENAISKYGIEKNVILLGMRDDVEKLLQMMDVFVLPSRFEGLPVVLIEAQATGLNCICSDKFGEESNASGKVKYFSLEMPLNEWAKAVLSFRKTGRNNTFKMLESGGYDINRNIEQLKSILLNC